MSALLLSASSQKSEIANPRASSKRYLSLDHWRGIACLIVVIHHATLPYCDRLKPALNPSVKQPVVWVDESSATDHKPGLFEKASKYSVLLTSTMSCGVEMFFVISGYCITASAESIRRSGRTIGEYCKRRFVRIYPVFWAAVLLLVAFCFAAEHVTPGAIEQHPWPQHGPWDLSVTQWLSSMTLTSTWTHYFTGEVEIHFPHQSWTLCYEEQFYAVIGLVLAFGGARFFRVVTILTAAIAGIDLAAMVFHIPVRGFFFDEHWFMFAAGVGIYWTLNCATARQAVIFQRVLIGSIVGLAILITSTSVFAHGAQFTAMSIFRLIGALVFAQVLISLKRYDEQIASLTSLNWLKSCGVMCYSIYLVHLLPGKWLSQQLLLAGYTNDLSTLLICIPLVLATSISLGYLFHVSVERRFMTSHHDANRERAKPVVRLDQSQTIPISEQAGWTLSLDEARNAIKTRQADGEQVIEIPGRKAA